MNFKHNSGMSYPDFIEEDGKYWMTETNKVTARIHEFPVDFYERLWSQFGSGQISTDGLVINLMDNQIKKTENDMWPREFRDPDS